MAEQPDIVTVERAVSAAPSAIFDLLTDPSRHHEFDGSGAVRAPRGNTSRLTLGAEFGMSMRVGVPYAMVNTVIEYEEDRRLAWQTRGPTSLGRYVGGRIWRYELTPIESGTCVSESWDITHESSLTKSLVRRSAAATRRNMAATLDRIDELLN